MLRGSRVVLFAAGRGRGRDLSPEDLNRLKTFFARAGVATRLLKSRLALPIAYPLNAAMLREGASGAPLPIPSDGSAKAGALNSQEWVLTQKGLAHVTPIVAGMSKGTARRWKPDLRERGPIERTYLESSVETAMCLVPAKSTESSYPSAIDGYAIRSDGQTVIGRKD
eukprot:s141_g7.t1